MQLTLTIAFNCFCRTRSLLPFLAVVRSLDPGSPEGCATILWKSAEKAEDAAKAMGITAPENMSSGSVKGNDSMAAAGLGSSKKIFPEFGGA